MTNTLSDVTNELVARASEGDARAVEAIIQALERPLFNVAFRMLLDRQDAEDATQEALIRIVTRLAQFRGESRFSTWAWRIAVRRILDFRAQRAASARGTFEAFAEDLTEGLDVDAVERTEDAILHQQLKLRCGRAMLQCLDGDHRIAFVLGELLEFSSSDAAEILDIEPATFRKRLSRARSALSAFLNRHCGIANPTAACACHRRLGRAQELGRVDGSEPASPEGSVAALRTQMTTLSELRRVTAFYRSEPESTGRTDFVATLRTMLGSIH
ncbi:RNA polymerase sigma factor [Myxococcaceae bacterium JPH2]|nr:RNA polymerase sigma factor [Myxococcaceae bacterium JPH2]